MVDSADECDVFGHGFGIDGPELSQDVCGFGGGTGSSDGMQPHTPAVVVNYASTEAANHRQLCRQRLQWTKTLIDSFKFDAGMGGSR